MSDGSDPRIRDLGTGVIVYEQDLFVWAKNSGQEIYKSNISVGAPSESNAGNWTAPAAEVPVLSIATEDKQFETKDPRLLARMKEILKVANADGKVDDREKTILNRIIQDVADDGKLNGSVPNILVGGQAHGRQ